MRLKTNLVLIEQIRAVVNQLGTCYFHGDGNIYVDEKDSNFRKDFGNPGQEESKYRIKFSKGDKIPGTIKEMNDALMESRNNEMLKDSITKETKVSTVFNFKMPEAETVKTEAGKKDTKKVKTEAEVEV
jgi:hypothetical protein